MCDDKSVIIRQLVPVSPVKTGTHILVEVLPYLRIEYIHPLRRLLKNPIMGRKGPVHDLVPHSGKQVPDVFDDRSMQVDIEKSHWRNSDKLNNTTRFSHSSLIKSPTSAGSENPHCSAISLIG